MTRLCYVVILILAVTATVFGQASFSTDNQKWRQHRNDELKAEDGWLTVVGLFWLKEGTTTIGTDPKHVDLALPLNSAPAKVGSLQFAQGVVTFRSSEGAVVQVNDKPVQEYVMTFDSDKPPDQFKVGSLKLGVIKRGNRYGLRVRDKNSPARLHFKGLKWFPARVNYRIIATFTAYDEPKEIKIMNVLGDELKLKTPGLLTFTLNGQKFELRPVIEDEKKLFIIFRDLTAGKTTYPAGRFLYADLPKDGKVVLDFNRAENPPCAFTEFATCPLPPRQNFMNISINAGERTYHKK
jgi:uncharacterized protein (DUF1684 family)